VDDDLHVIEHDPLARGKSVYRHGANAVFVSEPLLDFAGDRFQMRFRRSRANDEVIGEARDALQVEDDDVLCFLVRRVIGAGFG